MSIKNAIASLAVKDLSSAVQWYETLFGRPADSRPMAEVAEWKFERGDGCRFMRMRNALVPGRARSL
jgi:predicted enzyme related to lactoylglutathione lyase